MGGLSGCRPTRADIDLGAIVANFRALRRHVGRRDVWPVVKADAYGHGAAQVARALAKEPVAGFCVATASEGRELRQAGVSQPVLVMAGLWPGGDVDAFDTAVEYGLSAAIQDAAGAARLSRAARGQRAGPASVHLKVDTGMGRLGVEPARVVELAGSIDDDAALSLDGLLSNLATADSLQEGIAGHQAVADQAYAFEEICQALQREELLPAHRTLANSAGSLHHPVTWDDAAFTGVRPGLALYGASLTPGRDPLELRPAMRLLTELVAVRNLPEGAAIGYGLSFRTHRPTRVGVLPVGYHDGYPRSLSNVGQVWLRDRRVPVLGRISMDLTLVDVTDVPAAEAGDQVVLFGASASRRAHETRDARFASTLEATLAALETEPASDSSALRRPVSVEDIAAWADSIPHEILSRIGCRVPRHHAGPGDGEAGEGPARGPA